MLLEFLIGGWPDTFHSWIFRCSPFSIDFTDRKKSKGRSAFSAFEELWENWTAVKSYKLSARLNLREDCVLIVFEGSFRRTIDTYCWFRAFLLQIWWAEQIGAWPVIIEINTCSSKPTLLHPGSPAWLLLAMTTMKATFNAPHVAYSD